MEERQDATERQRDDAAMHAQLGDAVVVQSP